MKKLFQSITIFITLIIMFSKCTKSATENSTSLNGSLKIQFDNISSGTKLALNTTDNRYTSLSREKYNVTTLKYFISNISLVKSDGTIYVVPQDSSYFLIDADDVSSSIITLNIPQATYNKLNFIVGVDSAKSTSDISKRTGCLDVSNKASSLYWVWNSGYIFFKMEGNSPSINSMGSNKFQYHIGLYGGGFNGAAKTINNIRNVSLDLSKGNPVVKSGNIAPNIHLFVDINKALNGITMANTPMIMATDASANIANNFSNMFTHDHTEQ